MMEISKKAKLITIVLIILLTSVLGLSAESIWEGSAAMGRYGEFPFTGFYGASNSFPQNAFVEVENLENGKRTRLIIVNRLSDPGLLMLVSNEAAQELGIYQNDIARIKVRMLSSGSTVEAPAYDDLAYNPDPDLNPAAALIDPEDQVYSDIADSRTAVSEPEPAPYTGPEVVETTAPVPEIESAPEPESEPVAEPEAEPEIVVIEPDPVVEPVVETPVIEPPVVTEVVEAAEEEPEAELWPGDETISRTTRNDELLTDAAPVIDGLKDAEVLVTEKEVPADIADDSPGKPYEWPESVIPAEPEPEPEPLYLTMDELEEGSPAAEIADASRDIHSPETEVLWPDDGKEEPVTAVEEDLLTLSRDELASAEPVDGDIETAGLSEAAVPTLELVSAGLADSTPAYRAADSFELSMVPQIMEKKDEDAEYLTDSSDYHDPTVAESDVATAGLPAPEPDFPEEIIAILVGDHLDFSEVTPETNELQAGYLDSPSIVEAGTEASLMDDGLADAEPGFSDAVLTADAFPALPGGDDSVLVEVADGYVAPGKAEFVGTISDYPNPGDAGAPVDVPRSDDALADASPDPDSSEGLPGLTELPEVASAGDDQAETEDVDMVVPEYDESLEVTLVPAEVRPPELLEEETALAESEPEEGETLETDIAEHSPEIEAEPEDEPAAAVIVSVEPAEARPPEAEDEPGAEIEVEAEVEVEVEVEAVAEIAAAILTEAKTVPESEPELIAPEQVMVVSKLQQQKHYLQLGAFREKNSAIKAAGRLDAAYPVTILTDEVAGSYKLLLGPLTADESGIMLYNFRAGGYSDAFIRRIE